MIASLRGVLAYKSPEYIILDVNGVGYRVQVPLSTFYDLPDVEERVGLNIHTHVREDLIHLYGFLTLNEKAMFCRLLDVSGIGPKLALNILSGISADEMRNAIWAGNLARLQSIKGVGKRTAERIIVELRDKLKHEEPFPPGADRGAEGVSDPMEDAVSALLNLGYTNKEAEAAVRKAVRELEGTDPGLERLIKQALKVLL